MSRYAHEADSFFLLRSPSLPLDALEAWCATADSGPEEARARLRACLRAAVSDPAVREALFLASPDLESTLEPWLAGELPEARGARVERSLVRYLSRMAYRCTPFGLFAGVTGGKWGAASLELMAWKQSRRRTRMDGDALGSILKVLEGLPEVRRTERFRPNSSLYAAGGRLRYAEARDLGTQGREYHLVDLEVTEHLERTVGRAAAGATLEELALQLAAESGASLDAARAYCGELVDAQVLEGDLRPPLTGPEELPWVVERLKSDPSTRGLAGALEAWPPALEALDEAGPGNPPTAYRDLASGLTVYPVEIDPSRLFQVDQHRPARALELPSRVRREVEEAAETLRRLAPPRPRGPLEAFAQSFRDRYGDRWMPLLEVLDAEAGIGFGDAPGTADAGQPLLDGLAFPEGSPAPAREFTARDAYLLRRIQGLGPDTVWRLDDADFQALENPGAPPFPETFSAMAVLAAARDQDLASGAFQVLMEGWSGPSGARVMARFAKGDPWLEAHLKELVAFEAAAHPGAVLAEVVHLPDGRTGNIAGRPALRRHEIPFLGVGGVPRKDQIPASDLLVTVREGRVRLWSRSLGCEVLPRITSAHNHTRGLAVYRFLGRLQDAGAGQAAWSWGALQDAAFLPRVERGRHVLARARWRLERRETERALADAGGDPAAALALLRERRGLPRMVVLEDADNVLLVDLEQPLWAETLWHLVAGREAFRLTECFPAFGQQPLRGPEGRFNHEVVIPFRGPALPAPPLAGPAPLAAARSFPPGSEWLYAKLYCGRAVADRLLLELAAPLRDATRDFWDRWFFIRYADPEPHLRLRFRGDPQVLAGTLLPELSRRLEPLRARGLAWRLQLDTYEQELERYGGPRGMDLAEAWFALDSDWVLDRLEGCLGDEGAVRRWKLGLEDVDRIYAGMGLDLEARLRVARATRQSFLEEFGAAAGLPVRMGAAYRPQAEELDALLGREGAPGSDGPLGALAREARSGALGVTVEALAQALAHMHLNRLLRSEHRAQECVIMDFLQRAYQRGAARAVKPDPSAGVR